MYYKSLLPLLASISFIFSTNSLSSQTTNTELYLIISDISATRIEIDITKLAGFGTRNTFSDTISETRGIGAARRWIKSEFDSISKACNNCLEVFYQKNFVTTKDVSRVPKDAWVVNVVAIQRGTKFPNSNILMSGDIDSRASDTMDFQTDAPGANDNVMVWQEVLKPLEFSKYKFKKSIVYVGLSGEEQGWFGGKGLANYAPQKQWEIIAV